MDDPDSDRGWKVGQERQHTRGHHHQHVALGGSQLADEHSPVAEMIGGDDDDGGERGERNDSRPATEEEDS